MTNSFMIILLSYFGQSQKNVHFSDNIELENKHPSYLIHTLTFFFFHIINFLVPSINAIFRVIDWVLFFKKIWIIKGAGNIHRSGLQTEFKTYYSNFKGCGLYTSTGYTYVLTIEKHTAWKRSSTEYQMKVIELAS